MEKQPETTHAQPELEKARLEGDVYNIARNLQMNKLQGLESESTPTEKAAIQAELANSRAGNGYLPLPQGYQVARWLMIHKTLWPGTEQITEKDQTMMNEAAREFREAKNFWQLASLVHTAEYLGTTVTYEKLSEQEQVEFGDALAEIK